MPTTCLRGFARHLSNGVTESRVYRSDNTLRTIGAQPLGNVQLTGLLYTIDADKRRTAESDIVNSVLSSQYGYSITRDPFQEMGALMFTFFARTGLFWQLTQLD